jgi:hypothetical protein
MHKLLVSKKKAKVFAFVLFLMGLLILSFLNDWWPGIMIVIGVPLAMRQFSLCRYYDMCVTLFVFLGVFFTALFSFSERYLLPVLFIVGAIYLSFREYFDSATAPEDECEDDLNEEIEEDQQEKK